MKRINIMQFIVYSKSSVTSGQLSVVLLLLCINLNFCLTSNCQADVAINYYDEKNYHGAVMEWKKKLDAGARGKDLYYNMANAYFNLKQYPEAILFYHKALRWDPNCNYCLNNLKLARKAAGIESFELPQFVLTKWYKAILLQFQAFTWLALGIIFSCLILYSIYFLSQIRNQDTRIKLNTIIGMLALLCFIAAFLRDQVKHRSDEVILMKASGLFLSPDQASEIKQQLIPGQMLIIKDQLTGWVKVQTPEFDSGWIETEKIEPILP